MVVEKTLVWCNSLFINHCCHTTPVCLRNHDTIVGMTQFVELREVKWGSEIGP